MKVSATPSEKAALAARAALYQPLTARERALLEGVRQGLEAEVVHSDVRGTILNLTAKEDAILDSLQRRGLLMPVGRVKVVEASGLLFEKMVWSVTDRGYAELAGRQA